MGEYVTGKWIRGKCVNGGVFSWLKDQLLEWVRIEYSIELVSDLVSGEFVSVGIGM